MLIKSQPAVLIPEKQNTLKQHWWILCRNPAVYKFLLTHVSENAKKKSSLSKRDNQVKQSTPLCI